MHWGSIGYVKAVEEIAEQVPEAGLSRQIISSTPQAQEVLRPV